MKNFVSFIQNALMLSNDDNNKVGLSQFKERPKDFSVNKESMRSKDIKLSDLLRRA